MDMGAKAPRREKTWLELRNARKAREAKGLSPKAAARKAAEEQKRIERQAADPINNAIDREQDKRLAEELGPIFRKHGHCLVEPFGGQVKKDVKAAPKTTRPARRAQVDPVVQMAVANGAKLQRGEFETRRMPNPLGEVTKDGEPIQHRTVKRIPQFELLYRRHIIDRRMLCALEWYAQRAATSSCGGYRNPLGDHGGGGGAVGVGIPVTEASIAASHDIDWARAKIAAAGAETNTVAITMDVFDKVMRDEASFIEIARREAASRYVRISVRRRQDENRALFVAAARALADAIEARRPQGPRGIVAQTYD